MINKEYIYGLLADKKLDQYWKQRVLDSIASIEIVFEVKLVNTDIARKRIPIDQIRVACFEEMNMEYAEEIVDQYSYETLAPVTVIRYEDNYVLYMGSVRAILFSHYINAVDCIVVNCQTEKVKKFIQAAKYSLSIWSFNNGTIYSEIN